MSSKDGLLRELLRLFLFSVHSTSTLKATDYSRFSDSKPIEIVPLSADPNLRVWDPLHNRPFGDPRERKKTKITPLIQPGPSTSGGATGGRESVNAMKEEMLARYEALSTYQMAKKAAQILQTNATEKSPFSRKPNNKKKHIFIAE
ncbi:hypothetical protein PoB_002265600 [Plakobranchus ocellatus]|uniref:Uncharacterized protein n=1 Tax=Plakobranchus ocellatus TaxID=259542 RepID=A0AAV3ZJL4_9GAST|nr:hypothetical protein PoB_002265600 [Plakobranchus ocellatus]